MEKILNFLVPERIRFENFWVQIRKRNLWLIKLRYGAVLLLATMICGIIVLEQIIENLNINIFPLWIIAALILFYNVILEILWGHRKDKPYDIKDLYFSLTQIVLDFIALMFFIYFTGGVETPFYVFFIFHVIIGTLFLTGEIVSIIITFVLIGTITGSILEYHKIIPHQSVIGLLDSSIYDNQYYLIVFFSFFSIALYISIYLANSIAKQLYNRERSLMEAYQKLENSEKSKSQYVMTIVHDLKTPIAAAITYLTMILDGTFGDLSEKQFRPLDRSKTRLTNALGTINDVLHISKLKLGEVIEHIVEVDLIELLNTIHYDMKVLFESKNLHYDFIYDNKSQFAVKAEPQLLKLAISNLLSNSYKYTEANGKIQVKLSKLHHNTVLTILDTGIGIPKAEINKLFTDFYRSSISRKMGIEGTGLGLSLVKEIIVKYHGTIDVKSPSSLMEEPEKPGTEIKITFHEKL